MTGFFVGTLVGTFFELRPSFLAVHEYMKKKLPARSDSHDRRNFFFSLW